MSQHDPLVRLRHMQDCSREAVRMARGRSRKDLDTDRQFSLAVVRLLEMVGEATARVPEQDRRRWSTIPWADIVSLRNRLVHGYDEVNFDIVWAIIQHDLPPLIAELERILRPGGGGQSVG